MISEDIKTLLETLKEYGHSEITHSVFQNGRTILSICYLEQDKSYKITYFENENIEFFKDKEVELVTLSIHKAIRNNEKKTY
ncbi:hypothetical protein BEH_25945 (plasmid) [Priestia filamentosa]|uniref:Uncharacterized protein n=1 Tax=Priestia filamentosa TaxID=1402861 RepID=A0A1X7GQ17_9BACI|nr:hypothetical protein [Priestia filamentosa]AWG44803.1 hypothetical protein BEH_25945 [Priestia filamentosa]OXS64919.1 hypothetical protein B1B01_24410 [Priestia filamentosa]SMF73031.1 hypothetical protein SAMN06296056_11434 [Priestia filamentosa]